MPRTLKGDEKKRENKDEEEYSQGFQRKHYKIYRNC